MKQGFGDDMQPPEPFAYVGNHVERALATLPAETADPELSPNLHALVETDAEQVQKIEDELNKLRAFLTLEGAKGIWLDYIGQLVGQGRGPDGDTLYRQKIRAAARRNRSMGTTDDIGTVLRLLLGELCTQVVVLTMPVRTIGILLFVTTPLDGEMTAAVVEFANACRAAGVKIDGIAEIPATHAIFGFAGYPSPQFEGYGDGTDTGGSYARYLT